jgi:thiamine biosynthesis protein ThiS
VVYVLAIVPDAASSLIAVIVNGMSRNLAPGTTLLDLALMLRLLPEAVICEHNGTLCRANVFSETVLQDGDVVEWLHFMGGGDSMSYTGGTGGAPEKPPRARQRRARKEF